MCISFFWGIRVYHYSCIKYLGQIPTDLGLCLIHSPNSDSPTRNIRTLAQLEPQTPERDTSPRGTLTYRPLRQLPTMFTGQGRCPQGRAQSRLPFGSQTRVWSVKLDRDEPSYSIEPSGGSQALTSIILPFADNISRASLDSS